MTSTILGQYTISERGIFDFSGVEPYKFTSKKGYLVYSLQCKDGAKRLFDFHRLLLETFCPCENMKKLTVNHKDGNKKNNTLDNLEWLTNEDNLRHSGIAKLTDSDVRRIRIAYNIGFSIKRLSDTFAVNDITIKRVIKKKTWKHI